MGTAKKERNRMQRQGKVPGDPKVKGENFYRTAKKVKTLNVLKDGKAQRNKDGKIVKAASYQGREVPKAAIEPNRRWFTNTRVISQDTLRSFRDAVAEQQRDPYSVLLKTNKLPMSLIRDVEPAVGADGKLRVPQAKLTIEAAPFAETFGPKATRKRAKIGASTIADLAADSERSHETYEARREEIRLLSGTLGAEALAQDGHSAAPEEGTGVPLAKEAIFLKGTSKRIWNELYKVIDSSDVILHVLDARDPLGTRCRHVEKYLSTEAAHKHLVFVLNKIDLVPSSVAANWMRILQKDHPTCAMRSSIKNPFGRGSLIDLLRQFSILHKDRKQISVGLVGYPNVGKSSIINTLRQKLVAVVAPIPGQTKVWQYVTLMKRIYLIDCPGIVPPNQHDTPEDLLLRGVVRVENVDQPEQYIPGVLNKVKLHHMQKTYEIPAWKDYEDFLELLARKAGRLLKGGEPDLNGVAKMVLNDFMRGKIPWFTPPPRTEGAVEGEAVVEGREGRFGEMPRKRKREDFESAAATSMGAPSPPASGEAVPEDRADDEEAFEGFGSEEESECADESSVQNGEKAAREHKHGGDGAEDTILLESDSDEDDDGKESGDEDDDEDRESESDEDHSANEDGSGGERESGAADELDEEQTEQPRPKRRR